METIYREQGESASCIHKHLTPYLAYACWDGHAGNTPEGMNSTCTVMASDDNGETFRSLTEREEFYMSLAKELESVRQELGLPKV